MRRKLQRLLGRRVNVQATFIRFQTVRPDGSRSFQTMLLHTIRDERRTFLTDHTWMQLHGHLPDVALQPGDIITFSAEVTTYVKGPKHARQVDYCLARPQRITKVARQDSSLTA